MAALNMISYIFLAMLLHVAYATDPTQLQDFCVGEADPAKGLFVNGMLCKNPMGVTLDDFIFHGILTPKSTNNAQGSAVTTVSATQLPGLNTLGISMARVDFGPFGLNPPHIHPRGTEVQTVLEGTLYVGFVTSNQPNGGNKFLTKMITKGDIVVFPQGLIHFEFNIGNTPAVSLVSFSSQNPGVITIANATFGSQPPISVDVLSKAFQLDPSIVKYLQSKF
ncbi:putative germin-like protein 2-1 [Silene latifolia]|uniref:putative germin-like protein 2-1 n=1 Tax=Silene latifolia TaxID=37657 RepID=UPI003D76B2D8